MNHSHPVSLPLTWSLHSDNGDVLVDSSSVVTVVSDRSDSGPVYGWRQKLRAGLDATSSLSGNRETLTPTPGDLSGVFSFYDFTGFGPSTYHTRGIHIPYFPVSHDTNGMSAADNQAREKFYRSALNAQQAFSGGVAIGEFRETLHLLHNPAKALFSSVSEYLSTLTKRKKGSRPHRKRVLQDTWLEYSFGWLPLISDIRDAGKALARLNHQRIASQRCVGVGEFGSYSVSPSVGGSTNLPTATAEIRTVTKGSVRYKGAVTVSNDGGNTPPPVLRELGLDVRSFVPTAWNLIPYSFLVDYFTNIGGVLEAWCFNQASIRWALMGTLLETSSLPENPRPSFPSDTAFGTWSTTASQVGYVVATKRSVTRLPITDVPLPTIRFEIPGVSSRKWLNIAALATAHRRVTPFF